MVLVTRLPGYLDTCVLLDNNQPAGWDMVISLSLSLSCVCQKAVHSLRAV